MARKEVTQSLGDPQEDFGLSVDREMIVPDAGLRTRDGTPVRFPTGADVGTRRLEDFGAVGDGATDDTAALTLAWDWVRTYGGRLTCGKARSFLITDALPVIYDTDAAAIDFDFPEGTRFVCDTDETNLTFFKLMGTAGSTTTLTANISAGGASATVASTSGFVVGELIHLLVTRAGVDPATDVYYGHTGLIESITGSVIKFNPPVPSGFSIAYATETHSARPVKPRRGVRVRGIVFDGSAIIARTAYSTAGATVYGLYGHYISECDIDIKAESFCGPANVANSITGFAAFIDFYSRFRVVSKNSGSRGVAAAQVFYGTGTEIDFHANGRGSFGSEAAYSNYIRGKMTSNGCAVRGSKLHGCLDASLDLMIGTNTGATALCFSGYTRNAVVLRAIGSGAGQNVWTGVSTGNAVGCWLGSQGSSVRIVELTTIGNVTTNIQVGADDVLEVGRWYSSDYSDVTFLNNGQCYIDARAGVQGAVSHKSGASSGPLYTLARFNDSPTDGGYAGSWVVSAQDDAGNLVNFSEIFTETVDVSAGATRARVGIQLPNGAGSVVTPLSITKDGISSPGAVSAATLYATSGSFAKISQNTVNNAAGVTVTTAQIINALYIRSGAAAVSDTTPTAAQIVAAIGTSATVGMTFTWYTVNGNSGTLTIVGGSGVTLGLADTVGAGGSAQWLGFLTNVSAGTEAVTLSRVVF